jgi:hypothetical protein
MHGTMNIKHDNVLYWLVFLNFAVTVIRVKLFVTALMRLSVPESDVIHIPKT